MKGFIVFFAIVFFFYSLVNFYIFIRGWQALPSDGIYKTVYLVVFLFLSLSYIAGRVLEKVALSSISDFFIWVGAYWLAIMVYLLLAVLVIDIFRLLNHFTGIFPDFINQNYDKAKFITAISVLTITLIVVIAGRINAINPQIKNLTFNIPKKANGLKTLKIAAASDIHLGTLIGNGRLTYLVNKINAFEPDVVLFAGDIVDEDLAPVIKQNLGETLRLLKSKYGTYAIPGNHEFYGGLKAATQYLTEHEITVMRDSVAKIGNSFYLVGREDLTINNVRPRKKLSELMEQVDNNFPVILMDHQPFNLHEASDNKVDLQLSGHTHHGQLWPFNFITKAVYEVSWGYKKKENTHIYVSSGFGGWGPPIRTGNRPEILYITLNFE